MKDFILNKALAVISPKGRNLSSTSFKQVKESSCRPFTRVELCTRVQSIKQMYDEYEIGAWSLFAGGFINFGYWDKSLKNKPRLSERDRVESEKNLYRAVLNKLNISHQDSILEVASGLGYGSSLTLKEYSPKRVDGIDFAQAQVDRSNKLHQSIIRSSDRISFRLGTAEHIPFELEEFDKVFSIEALQHFSSYDAFFEESLRVLKPNGQIAFATFFATDRSKVEEAKTMIKTTENDIDKLIPIDEIHSSLKKAGFQKIKIESIGDHVWPLFDKWIAQTEFKDTWNRNWYRSYQQRLVDYYIVTADKPA